MYLPSLVHLRVPSKDDDKISSDDDDDLQECETIGPPAEGRRVRLWNLRPSDVQGVWSVAALTHGDPLPDIIEEWRKLCSQTGITTIPMFGGAYKKLRKEGTMMFLHQHALTATGYVTPYEQMKAKQNYCAGLHSVEHVIPQSHCRGRRPSIAENDPYGWVMATRVANSTRKNRYLVLWPLEEAAEQEAEEKKGMITHDGVEYFVPPLRQRQRLAHKWHIQDTAQAR